jgi:hypothetical protein
VEIVGWFAGCCLLLRAGPCPTFSWEAVPKKFRFRNSLFRVLADKGFRVSTNSTFHFCVEGRFFNKKVPNLISEVSGQKFEFPESFITIPGNLILVLKFDL